MRLRQRARDARHCTATSHAVGLSVALALREISMARITVQDCLQNVDNLFDMVMIAAKRARRLANGAEPLVERENDKPTVIALREIAAGLINEEILQDVSEPENDLLSSEEAEELLASTPLPTVNGPG